MAQKTGIRITSRGAAVKTSSPKAKNSAVKRKKASMPKKEALRFDDFADSYLETAIWADRPEGCDANRVWPACIPQILEDCYRFQRENERLLDAAYQLLRLDEGDWRPYDVTDAGHDFWLSRNGHGTGFWDRELGEVGDKLHEAANAYGSMDVLPGDGKQKNWLFIE
jgi:hypothetical protein